MKRFLPIFVIMAFVLGCSKNEGIYSAQEKLINKYIETQQKSFPDAKITYNSGAVRFTIKEGTGAGVNAKGKVTVYYSGYILSKSATIEPKSLFATNRKENAKELGLDISDETKFAPIIISLKDKTISEGLRNGLANIKTGEECIILFSSKYGYKGEKVGIIPAHSPMAFHIWVQNINE